jgi:nucleotide-binding universal stress UspA family protein
VRRGAARARRRFGHVRPGPALALSSDKATSLRQEDIVTPLSRVLCVVDIDDAARTTFEQALAIARAHQARLLLVCPVPAGQPFNQRASERVAYLLKLRRLAEAADVDVHVSVQSGEAAEIALLHARSRAAALVVVGVEHGRADGYSWGAVAEDVLRSAACPTLVVPAGAPPRGAFERVLCAVTLSPHPDVSPAAARLLANPRAYTLTLFHAVASRSTGAAALQALQDAIPPDARGVAVARVGAGAAEAEILAAARAADADLLVIGARARNRLTRRLFGVTRALLTTSGCPVLAVPIASAAAHRAAA